MEAGISAVTEQAATIEYVGEVDVPGRPVHFLLGLGHRRRHASSLGAGPRWPTSAMIAPQDCPRAMTFLCVVCWVDMAQTEMCACCGSGEDTEPVDADATVETTTSDMTCYCPLDGVISTVGKKYTMQIIAMLGAEGPVRYGAIREELGVTSDSTLAERLDQLADHELIERRSYDEIPPRVEYSLTARGRELESHLQPLLEWAAHAEHAAE